MLIPAVNVLSYANREDSTRDHSQYARSLTILAIGNEPGALDRHNTSEFRS